MNMQQMINRAVPLGDPGQYVTYGISATPDTAVVAACHEVGCEFWRDGWDSIVDERTADGQIQARTIRGMSKRDFRELRTADGLTVFRFKAGQRCFREHYTKPDRFIVRDGDWRGNPTGRGRLHANGRDWAEDFAEHEGALADLRKQG